MDQNDTGDGPSLDAKTRQLLEEGRAVWLQKPFVSEALGAKIGRLFKGGS